MYKYNYKNCIDCDVIVIVFRSNVKIWINIIIRNMYKYNYKNCINYDVIVIVFRSNVKIRIDMIIGIVLIMM